MYTPADRAEFARIHGIDWIPRPGDGKARPRAKVERYIFTLPQFDLAPQCSAVLRDSPSADFVADMLMPHDQPLRFQWGECCPADGLKAIPRPFAAIVGGERYIDMTHMPKGVPVVLTVTNLGESRIRGSVVFTGIARAPE